MTDSPLLLPADRQLRVGSYNLLNGGQERWEDQVGLLGGLNLDVLNLQEAKHLDQKDSERVYATAERLGMQPLLARSRSHGCHLVTYYRWPRVQCLGFSPDGACGNFHHTALRARMRITGVREPVLLLHTHLDPFSPQDRLAEVQWLTEHAGARTLLAGDLNTPGADDEEPEDWDLIPAHQHSGHRLMLPDGSYGGTDRRAIRALMHAGFVDPPVHLDQPIPRTAGHLCPEQKWDHRADHVLLSPTLAPALHSYEVLDNTVTQQLSDHLPVIVTLDITRM
ncbi:endonuclease/exonuclease/phosphatase [Streptomyces sp. NPDC006237]|uniref:endonuclease/exonuclease/phosphatase n=1 Tax=Streptomyces sp. NPDC006237 TaxID=3154474 RepID=UPI0033B49657